jgi:predicted ArsR family transcriptional regulator
MAKQSSVEDPVGAVALLNDPKRRQLYELVVAGDRPVGRDEAAGTLGISRELAAFHLDRLVAGGLLDTEYRRLGGRRGPGAGRPAKLYRRANREVAVSFPPRRYDLAADLMATALHRLGDAGGSEVAASVARERGSAAGAAARRKLGARQGRGRSLASLELVLREGGYEPQFDTSTGTLFLRNCPYNDLAADHRELTCGMNLAWAEGVVDSLGSPVRAELAPEPGRCCVVFRTAPG